MFRCFRIWWYLLHEARLENTIVRGEAIIEDDKRQLGRDTKRLLQARTDIRAVRAKLAAIDRRDTLKRKPEQLISEALR